MSRRWIVLAIALTGTAIAAWLAVLADRSSTPRTSVASISAGPTPMPPADAALAPDVAVLDGAILDLGFGIELTVPSFFTHEKIPGERHAIMFGDDSRRIRVVANAVSASRVRRHDDPLDGARALAKDQKTRISQYENTPDGTYVIFDGTLEHVPMRQHLITKRTSTGRVSVWVILLADGITNRDNLALLDELRTGGRLIAR